MSKYVDVDKLNLYDLFMKSKNDSGVWVRYRDVEILIKNAPTADVQEVRHGKNLDNEDWTHFKCSLCGADCWDTHSLDRKINYCYFCGAKIERK